MSEDSRPTAPVKEIKRAEDLTEDEAALKIQSMGRQRAARSDDRTQGAGAGFVILFTLASTGCAYPRATLQGTNPDIMRKCPSTSCPGNACEIPVLAKRCHKSGRVIGR
eukprot:gene24881-1618_t